jgi:STE24 endopeptidase
MYTTLFWIIIAILAADFILELVLDNLNERNVKTELPTEMQGIYDAEKYKKQQEYFKTNQKFNKVKEIFSFVVIMLMFFLFGFEFFDSIARGISSNPIVISLLFFGMLFFANELLSLPFGIYQTFTIEEKFGFNKMTPSIFATDLLKEWIMTILLGGGVDLIADFILPTHRQIFLDNRMGSDGGHQYFHDDVLL